MAVASLPVMAGIASTLIFASSTLPMLSKAVRTRDLASYSLGNLALANIGNAVHSVYVFSLPAGPLWILHSFYLASTGLMFAWFLRYEVLPMRGRRRTSAATSSRATNALPAGTLVPMSRERGGTDWPDAC